MDDHGDTNAASTMTALPASRIAGCGDASCELLVDPIPRPRPAAFTVHIQPAVQRVVLVDNGKPNSMDILRLTQAILRERGVDVKEEIVQKPSPTQPSHRELLAQLAEERGLLLLGVND